MRSLPGFLTLTRSRLAFCCGACLTLCCGTIDITVAEKKTTTKSGPVHVAVPKGSPVQIPTPPTKSSTKKGSTYRGWDYLVSKLKQYGVSESDLMPIYQSPSMPWFSFVPFALRPREHHSIYRGFLNPSFLAFGATFLRQHAREFDEIEKLLRVPREVIVAILIVESQIGRFTGREMILYRLSRIASVADPANMQRNYLRLKATDKTVTLPDLQKRAQYLEGVFLPEIPSLIEIGKRNKINILNVRGSIAGAFGMPQFLPSAFLRFGVDGDHNGHVSLFDDVDAMWSTAKYLAHFGFKGDLTTQQKRDILWHYNKSDAYIDTVLRIADGIRRKLG